MFFLAFRAASGDGPLSLAYGRGFTQLSAQNRPTSRNPGDHLPARGFLSWSKEAKLSKLVDSFPQLPLLDRRSVVG